MIVDPYTKQSISTFCEHVFEDIGRYLVGVNVSRIFAMTRVLSEREVLPLLNHTLPVTLIPGNFIALFVRSGSIDKIISYACHRAFEQLREEILRDERYSIRPERKRPWAPKTRRPFRGRIDRVTPTFREKIELAERVIDEIGPAWEIPPYRGKGRPPKYDPKKLSAPILVKGMLSFGKLASELRNINYDATLDGSDESPRASHLHHVFQNKIPRGWLDMALRKLDDMSAEFYSKFDENVNVFVTDNSSVSCETLETRMIAMKQRLMREYQPFLALTRNATNTVRAIFEPTNKIAYLMPVLPLGSIVTADSEFDVGENYWEAIENGIELHVKQAKGPVRNPGRKKGRKSFDKKKYRKRKLGERFFGNLEARRSLCYYRKNRHKGMLLLGCEHNILEWFKNKAWCDQFVELTF